MKIAYFALLSMVAVALSGCASRPQIIREPVPVISSKPYRYLKYTPQCDASTIRRIKTHNQTHWRVKQAEAKAAE